jgi:hypothetical protein
LIPKPKASRPEKKEGKPMSAYVVDKDLIDKLIAGALRAELFMPADATANGQMLWRENVTSVAYRYNLATRDATELAQYEREVEAYTFEPCAPTAQEIDSAIDCLDYQSCEHDGWEASEAYALLQQLRSAYPSRRFARAGR